MKPTSSTDPHLPQTAHYPLAFFAVYISITVGPHSIDACHFNRFPAPAIEPLRAFAYLFALDSTCRTAFYPRHKSSLNSSPSQRASILRTAGRSLLWTTTIFLRRRPCLEDFHSKIWLWYAFALKTLRPAPDTLNLFFALDFVFILGT